MEYLPQNYTFSLKAPKYIWKIYAKRSIPPHALKGQKLLAQGIRPGYLCPHAWRPERAKALYGDPNIINKPKKIGEKMM